MLSVSVSMIGSNLHTSLVPVRGCGFLPHTPQVRAEQQQAAGAPVLIAIDIGSCLCVCVCLREEREDGVFLQQVQTDRKCASTSTSVSGSI